jgi:hypothetical protein
MYDRFGTPQLKNDSHGGGRSKVLLTRRRDVLLGAAAGIGAVAAFGVAPARAVLRFDLNQGNVQPMPIALPDFLAASPSDHYRKSQAQRPVRSNRSGRLHREDF